MGAPPPIPMEYTLQMMEHAFQEAGRALPVPPPTECRRNHAHVSTAIGITDGGMVWSRCPDCSLMVEGAMRTGVMVGNENGLGRGILTMRQKARLMAWRGWSDFLGPR